MTNMCAGIRAMKRGALAVFLVLAISSATEAGPLGVDVAPFPNILAGFITSSYTATTGAFVANGWALTLDTGTSQTNITTPFMLTATIENNGSGGVTARNGNLTIGSVASPLLSSFSLIGFAFTPTIGGTLEFLFQPAAGSYIQSGLYDVYKPVDVQLQVGNSFLGNFNNSWFSSSNTAQVREDPIPNPEPSTLLLMAVGAAGLFRRFRKPRA